MNPDIRKRALRILQTHDVSERRLSELLQKKGYEACQIREEIVRLKEAGYLDDRRVAEQIVRAAIRKRKGVLYARFYLKKKGISRELSREVLARIYPPVLEYQIARQIRESLCSRKTAQQIPLALRSRGFSSEAISRSAGDTCDR